MRFAVHDGQEPFLRLRIVLGRTAQGFDEAQQRGQRRAEFVADVGDKIATDLAGLFDVGGVLKADQHAFTRAQINI